jgi:hypothetical protein
MSFQGPKGIHLIDVIVNLLISTSLDLTLLWRLIRHTFECVYEGVSRED